jgi:hypothetical protein
MHDFLIDLLDIGKEVALGSWLLASPFQSQERASRTRQFINRKFDASSCHVDCTILIYPQSTSDAIAQYLRVHHNSNLGLHFWDTANPNYHTITSSPGLPLLRFSTQRFDHRNDHNQCPSLALKSHTDSASGNLANAISLHSLRLLKVLEPSDSR